MPRYSWASPSTRGDTVIEPPPGAPDWPKAFYDGWPILPALTWEIDETLRDIPSYCISRGRKGEPWSASWGKLKWHYEQPNDHWARYSPTWPLHKAQLICGAHAKARWLPVIAFDLDLDDEDLAATTRAQIMEALGDGALLRWGTRPRCAIVLRVAEPIRSRQVGHEAGGVELFAWSIRQEDKEVLRGSERVYGNVYSYTPGHLLTIYGSHRRTGMPYVWDAKTGAPHERKLADLPVFDVALIEDVLRTIKATWMAAGGFKPPAKKRWFGSWGKTG